MSSEAPNNLHTQEIPASAPSATPSNNNTTVVMPTAGGEEVFTAARPRDIPQDATADKPSVPDYNNIDLPGFEMRSLIGVGGMGAVYLARQISLNRYVAVKMIKNEFAHLARYQDRFLNEARTMAALNHPNIIACYDIVTTPQHVFMIMEFIPGHMNVGSLIQQFGRLDDTLVIRILTDVVEGLAYMYQRKYIHRDLKPDNLMVYCSLSSPKSTPAEIFGHPGNRIVISDFGIAREIKGDNVSGNGNSQTVLGSIQYMAPEQYFTPDEVDFRADIYALASTAYYLLTGELPFKIENKEELMEYKKTNGVPDPRTAQISADANGKSKPQAFNAELCEIIMRMGRPNPEDRYRSYDILLQDLHHVQTLNDIWFRVAGREARKRAFRHGLFLSGAIALLVILPFAVKNYIWKRYFSPVQVSLAQSTAFWEEEGAKAWHRMPPDLEEPHVYLRGMHLSEPLILKQKLVPGNNIDFQVRFYGVGQMGFGLRTPDGVCLQVLLRRDENAKINCMFSYDGKPSTYIGDFKAKLPNKWMKFQIQIDRTQVVVLMDNKILGVGHFHETLGPTQFFVSLSRNRYLELKDVYVDGNALTDGNQ